MDRTEMREALTALASNHRWTWHYRTAELLDELPTARAERHPASAVRALTDDELDELVASDAFVATVVERVAILRAVMETAVTAPDIVYFSAEFGISGRVPQYSGGLGILAGDHLKSASDLRLSFGAVGLFYRHGFFRQEIVDGGQGERFETYQAEDFGFADTGLVVDVPIADRNVQAKVWKMDVGRVPLLLLDTDVDGNSDADRRITDRLYSGDSLHRLHQELVLGAGGARAVAAMGWRPGVYHSNEGHAGFLALELIDAHRRPGKARDLHTAVDQVQPHVLFTTHTPVPAGIDRFDRGMIEPYLRPWAAAWRDDMGELLGLGAEADHNVFNMAALCLRVSSRANGVSKLHGEVSRELFSAIPGGAEITSITNGVHGRTWISPELQFLLDDHLGRGWDLGEADAWAHIDDIPTDSIVATRQATRRQLAALVAGQGHELERDALVFGFARRFATYKRATLLLRDRERIAALLADDDHPVHIVFAGKAHPADEPGKALLREIVAFANSPEANGRFTFVPDYDIEVARGLYYGSDVWLNNPIRPREASGTSGEKAALNGALNCSIRDGWWAEMSDGTNGWDIPISPALDEAVRDDEEAAALVGLLGEIAAEFHADERGVPSAAWIARMRHNWTTLGPQVLATRMVADYRDRLYQPMLDALK